MSPSITNARAFMTERSIAAGTFTSNGNGSGVDISDLMGDLRFTLENVTVAGTTPTMTFTVTHSDDNVSFVAAPAALSFGAVTAAGILSVDVDKRALKKWVRLERSASGGTSPSFALSLRVSGVLKYN